MCIDLEEIQVKLIAKNGINAQVDVLLEEIIKIRIGNRLDETRRLK